MKTLLRTLAPVALLLLIAAVAAPGGAASGFGASGSPTSERAALARGPGEPVPDFAALLGHGPIPARSVGAYRDTIGESTEGRPIHVLRLGDPKLPGRILAFGCIHGDECAARTLHPLTNGCPDPRSDIFLVSELDPDGSAAGTRLNGRGVDLNRNFPASWRPIGSPGSLEYAGPRPFSEPESRLAASLVRGLEPRVTLWFHQFPGVHPFVRAWGQSVPAARRYAERAGIAFRLMRWQDGTAPNWQNHNFPGTASFVVELPDGPLPAGLKRRLERALVQSGREVGRV
jgi:murein peptide amidase A